MNRKIHRLCWGYKPRRRPTLPHGRPCSTIGAGELDDRVRDGIGYDLPAIATRKWLGLYDLFGTSLVAAYVLARYRDVRKYVLVARCGRARHEFARKRSWVNEVVQIGTDLQRHTVETEAAAGAYVARRTAACVRRRDRGDSKVDRATETEFTVSKLRTEAHIRNRSRSILEIGKPIDQLVPVSSADYPAITPGLSTT